MKHFLRELRRAVNVVHCAISGHQYRPLPGSRFLVECTRCNVVEF